MKSIAPGVWSGSIPAPRRRGHRRPKVISHGPKVHEIKIGGYHGYFESPERALRWAEDRLSGKPYNPIPQRGEV